MNPRTPGDNALRHVGDLNRRIVENTGDCVKILALDGRLLYINSEGLRALEIADASPLMDCPLAGFFDGDVRRAAEAAMEQARRGDRGRFQYMMRTASGVAKWFDSVVTPITNADGAVVQLLAISRDITERRREEAFRSAQHQVLEMIATSCALPIVLDSLVRMIEKPGGRHVLHGAAAR